MLAACGGGAGEGDDSIASKTSTTSAIKTVFVIVMENHDWSQIQGNGSAPYINHKLLPMSSYALNYRSPQGLHPSEPNYIWLEAGSNLGITDDKGPGDNHKSTTDHLVSQLTRAGKDWRSYQMSIEGDECPLEGAPLFSEYVPRHNPMVYFDDVTNGNDEHSSTCIQHVRPYDELSRDLATNKVAAYNFITPDLCHDMHGGEIDCLFFSDQVKNGDDWLASEIPKIMRSNAYKSGGAIFITWDESEHANDPIGMIVLSPFAKGGGYNNHIPYTHSSMLRSVERIFGLPYLRGAAQANDLADLFTSFP